jgi:hypothetical protein
VLIYGEGDRLPNDTVGVVEQSRTLQATEFAEARHIIESIDRMKRDLMGFFKKFQREYVVSLVLLRKQAMPN